MGNYLDLFCVLFFATPQTNDRLQTVNGKAVFWGYRLWRESFSLHRLDKKQLSWFMES